MRIALFTETFLPKVDGIVNTLCRVLEHLASRGVESLLFAPAGAPERFAATRVVGLPGYPFPLYPELTLVPPYADVGGTLARFAPDLVHVLNPVSLGIGGLWHAQALRCPVVASYHTDLPGFAARWGLGVLSAPLWACIRLVHNQAALNLAPSRATACELEDHGVRSVAIWGRGVDARRFHPRHACAAMRTRLTQGRPDAPLLLYVGRLSPEKRVEWLAPVIAALPKARLAIVGDGPSRAALEPAFDRTRTTFTGYLAGDELAAAYASADVFVFPGANETFGNVALEAMASGLPVIAPRAGGIVDHVVDGRTGLLFDPESPGALVMAARWLVQDRLSARRIGIAARAHARSRTWEVVLDGLLEHYAAVLGRSRVERAA
jgi:glycosyltransferase involved in cell wall biosynthesis